MSIDATGHSHQDAKARISSEIVERERHSLLYHSKLRFVHWLVLILSIVVTFSVWQYARYQIALRTEARFEFAAKQIGALIEERLEEYELALWGGVAAMRSFDNRIGLKEWRTFAQNLEIERRFPGINGIGVIHQIAREDVDAYLREQRIERPNFRTYPEHDGDVIQPITFIEPEAVNFQAVGLDMMHERNRRSSLQQARDTGTAQITGPIVLVQDEGKTPGFLFFAPFYASDDHSTVQSRQAQFEGAIYAPFVVKKLMEGLLDKDRRSVAIRITDNDQVIYDEISEQDTDYDTKSLGQQRLNLMLYGREWMIDIRAGLDFRAQNAGVESSVLLIAGILIDLALFGLFILLSRANKRGLRFADMATAALDVETQALQATNKKLELARVEAESASAMKSVFLSTISHEVRTPLTAISGILVLLERADLTDKQSKLVQAGKRASENLIKLLTDVLDSSRLEANAMELWEREVEIKPLVEEWQTLAAGMVSKLEKDIVIVSEISDTTPEKIFADDIRLSQILSNLMDNAIRFTESGQISIKTYLDETAEDQPDFLVLSVQDTGIGIAKDDLAVIFKRFRQVDESVTRERGGAGLGLAISHDLVQLMGGKLEVTSELGIGTNFELHLPVHGTTVEGRQIE